MIFEQYKRPAVVSQAPSAVLMVRPHHFTPNPQTVKDNAFQAQASEGVDVAKRAYDEVSQVATVLADRGVDVHLFEDRSRSTPDSVFPNNWLTTHADGKLGLYPMFCENRRGERRQDIIDFLRSHYLVSSVIDYSAFENQGQFLEGTGALVLDHQSRVAYAARSHRMNDAMLSQFCQDFGYEAVVFDAVDNRGVAIYHTNVMMCVGTHYALVALENIANVEQKVALRKRLESTGKVVISLSEAQISEFAANALELATPSGSILAMSQSALTAFTQSQREQLEQWVDIVPFAIPTIELAGGSVRCMLAGIHLAKKKNAS